MVRINYTDASGKAHSLTRVAYGLSAAKELEAALTAILTLHKKAKQPIF